MLACLRGSARAAWIGVLLGLLGLGLALARLAEGPVALPAIAAIAERMANERLSGGRVSIGGATLGLGRGGGPAGLVFEEVRVVDAEGATLLAAPRLGARFAPSDLLTGRLRPLAIRLDRPRIAVLRAEDGRLRAGLGLAEAEAEPTGAPGRDAVARIMDGLAGDAPLPPALARLDRVIVRDATLVVEDAATGRAWRAHGADLRLRRTPDGVSAVLRAGVAAGSGGAAAGGLRLTGTRLRGAGRTELRLDLDGLDIAALAGGPAGRPHGRDAALPAPRPAEGPASPPLGQATGDASADRPASADGVAGLPPGAAAPPGLSGLGLSGRVGGRVTATIGPEGALERLEGRIAARGLVVPGLGPDFADLGAVEARVVWQPGTGRLAVERLAVSGPVIETELSGHLTPDPAQRAAASGPSGAARTAAPGPAARPSPAARRPGPRLPETGPDRLAADLDLARLSIDAPGLFSEPLDFDGGRIAARLALDPLTVEISELALAAGEMRLSAEGQVGAAPDGAEADRAAGAPLPGWRAGLALSGTAIPVARVKSHWPIGTGGNARPWVVEHLLSGRVDRLSAEIGLGAAGPPEVRLDFAFSDVASRYLGDMPPIEGGGGTARMTLQSFALDLAEGRVAAPGGTGPIALGGSSVVMADLWAEEPPAEIELFAAGSTAAALALIDAPPLGLVSKLGLPLGRVGGRAEVRAELDFPLLNDLAIEEVGVLAEARLSDTTLSLPLGSRELAVSAPRLDLTATAEEMTLAGRPRIAGAPWDLRWREVYGAGPGAREVDLSGAVGPAQLAALGLEDTPLQGGSAAMTLSARGSAEETRLSLTGDLSGARLAVPVLRWTKPEGRPGRLSAEGRLAEGALALDTVSVETGGLVAEGRGRLDAAGRPVSGRVARFALDDRAELTAELARGADGALEIDVTGEWLDLSGWIEDPPGPGSGDAGAAEGPPLRLEAAIDRVRLSPAIRLEPAQASLSRDGDGHLSLDLSARAGGVESGRFTAAYTRTASAPGEVRVGAPDAGGLLAALGLFAGGSGGTLEMRATLGAKDAPGITGRARIADMTVRDADTVGTILSEGGVEDAAAAVEGGGLTFDSIVVPFSRSAGTLRIERAIARSPLLAVTLEGAVAEAEETLDLRGVISPAYALTGALDEVPLLGALLTGGEGEGIIAMTFRVGGTLEDPQVSVNPLSLLTPGFLRGVFSGSGGQAPSDRFVEQLGRED